ncbi:MAG: helix-turn-helix domain-containing protein [Thermodesulfobacteriota bacterium]
MPARKKRVSSGVNQLDQLLGGLYIGDNVIWYDDAGSLAAVFCMNFIRESQIQNKPIIYVSFDRSPKNLLEKLGSLGENQNLTILDCFTNGKGDGSEIFNKFYEKDGAQWPYQIIKVNEPWKPEKVAEAIYGLHKTMLGDVRFVIESLTGMQDLWEGEEHVLKFYSRSCPRLYELDTIAYWVVEKGAHSSRLKAHINQIAQVAVDLAIKRGKTTLTILKAEKRNPENLNEPFQYVSEGADIGFEKSRQAFDIYELGKRIKTIRQKQGLSQKELASMIGVTPSTISQVESNLIYPSLPALFKMAENLSVSVGAFFQDKNETRRRLVFQADSSVPVHFTDLPKGCITGKMLTPPDFNGKAEPYLIQIPARKKLPAHFFIHKGEELGYLLEGTLEVIMKNEVQTLQAGDTIYLAETTPSQWKNTGSQPAVILWIKLK